MGDATYRRLDDVEDRQEATSAPAPEARSVSVWQAASGAPALVALILGALYATGALVKAAELRGAGMSVRDTLTLIPIESHLGRGIQVVLEPEILLGLVLIGAFTLTLFSLIDPGELVTRGRIRRIG